MSITNVQTNVHLGATEWRIPDHSLKNWLNISVFDCGIFIRSGLPRLNG